MSIQNVCPCGNEFETIPARVKAGRGKFCSKACMYRFRSPRPRGLTYNIVAQNRGWFKVGEVQIAHDQHKNWKGDQVGYQELHRWVRRWKTKPENCEHCGESRRLEWANKSHEYLRDLDDWLALCRQCHRTYDKTHWGVATAKYGKAGLQGMRG